MGKSPLRFMAVLLSAGMLAFLVGRVSSCEGAKEQDAHVTPEGEAEQAPQSQPQAQVAGAPSPLPANIQAPVSGDSAPAPAGTAVLSGTKSGTIDILRARQPGTDVGNDVGLRDLPATKSGIGLGVGPGPAPAPVQQAVPSEPAAR